jgi:2,3-bisphosphoglycerate-independent phosphoglycerate mutase
MSPSTQAPRRPVILVVLDGVGVNPARLHNGLALAQTPRLDEYLFRYPMTLLDTSGGAVGLPEGQMGNSEVGHMTLGSGGVVRQDLVLIDDAIADGSFQSNCALNSALEQALARGRPVHLLGLVSDGGVHSHLRHLLALMELCRRRRVPPLVHMVCDGRDTAPRAALAYLPPLERALEEAGGAVVTVMGRWFAMDRDRRWERVERAWRAVVLGKGRPAASSRAAIEAGYARGEGDEFIAPTVLPGYTGIQAGDVVISFNFRKDRPRQMVAALARLDFDGFDRGDSPLAAVTCMMEYDTRLGLPYAFEPERPAVTLSQVIGAAGLCQLHCAETEKYAHVTHFFNGGSGDLAPGEEHRLVPSPRVATYDLKPEMSAQEVADAVIEALRSGRFGFLLVNFANGDMVGHTGRRHAVLRALEALDTQVGRVLDAAVAAGWSAVLTADHGNCELLVDPLTDMPHTQHTTFPVPCVVIDRDYWRLAGRGGLADVAPTVLQLLGLPQPRAMTGRSLLREVIPVPLREPRERHAA